MHFPVNQHDFTAVDEPETVRIPSISKAPGTFGDRGQVFQVHLLQVEVDFESDINGLNKPRNCATKEQIQAFFDAAESEWAPAFEIAQKVAELFLQWVRATTGQPWLGIATEPAQQHGRSHLVDIDSDIRLGSWGPKQKLTWRSDLLAADAHQLETAATGALTDTPAPVALTLLADAKALADDHSVPDNSRAVLAAATACEIKTKQSIRDLSPASNRDTVELLLRRQSTLGPLLDETLKAVVGTSLRIDNNDLFRQVNDLVTARNLIIHRGHAIDEQETGKLLLTATNLFLWLDNLLTNNQSTP
ncbi:hypothetical protein [Lentzea kentuckyensis]|uniref:hypothetical protein n=1 Tax=Lentzea kentuckyensis TaxID=360086 RepID=UPI00117ACD79|nr:hypothetical protein [Lentzea kentuckyensis]